jgi:hypothetical protein
MYKWLGRQLEGRSVAEMSIMHTLTGVCSLLVILLCVSCMDSDSSVLFLVALSLWFIFLIWLWIGLVKTAWRSGRERLGMPIFRYLQIGVLVMIVISVLPWYRSTDDFKILHIIVLAFDIMIAWMIVNFLFLAWFARCKIPLHVYCEIGSIIGMVVLQIWLLS